MEKRPSIKSHQKRRRATSYVVTFPVGSLPGRSSSWHDGGGRPKKKKQNNRCLVNAYPWITAASLLQGSQHFNGLRAHEACQLVAILEFIIRHILEVLVWAACRTERRDADARAIELADNKVRLAIRTVRALLGVLRDEVTSPQKREWLVAKAEGGHDRRDVLVDELILQPDIIWNVGGVRDAVNRRGRLRARLIEGHDIVATNSGQATHRLLVNDLEKPIAHHLHANLAFLNAREEALVNKLATGLFATLEILAWESRLPLTRCGARAVHTEGQELAERVVLNVIVVHLHELEHVVVFKEFGAKG
mmetsp:Transcript_54887/g.124068  ORF Transcript_54887/g.124068 Transcript_54887/m.124068 type:complete len:306 (+) Transcript_54887:51-968(+)